MSELSIFFAAVAALGTVLMFTAIIRMIIRDRRFIKAERESADHQPAARPDPPVTADPKRSPSQNSRTDRGAT